MIKKQRTEVYLFIAILIIIVLLAATSLTGFAKPADVDPVNQVNIYSVWREPNLHLMMSDNGTPNNYDDDWVVDWEDNREIQVNVLDK